MATLLDPYYAVRDDMIEAVHHVHILYVVWADLLENTNTATSTAFTDKNQVLQGELLMIDADLTALEQAVAAAEQNKQKFNIDARELADRKTFLRQTRNTIKSIKDHMSSRATRQKIEADKQRRPRQQQEDIHQVDAPSPRRQEQQQILRQQDETLDELAAAANRLEQSAQQIHVELTDQQRILGHLEGDVDRTSGKTNWALKKLKALVPTGATGKISTILCLMVVGIILVCLVLYTEMKLNV